MDSKKDVNNKQKAFLTKKEKENIRKNVLEEIDEEVRVNLCENVVKDLNERLNDEYKDNLKQTITDEIIVDIKNNIKEEEKKLSRRKSFKIVRLYIYILLLIAAAIFLIYKLYETGNLDLLKDIKPTEKITTTTTMEIRDLKWYMNKYGNILNNIKFDNIELLKGNYDVSKISMKDKLAMAYLNLNSDAINKDGVIYSIIEENLKASYKSIFGEDETYVTEPFSVGNVNFAYSSQNATFIAITNNDIITNNIKTEIIDIKEENDTLYVTTLVALIKDDKIYNINNLEKEIKAYNAGETLYSLQNDLSRVTISFKKINNNYYISYINI